MKKKLTKNNRKQPCRITTTEFLADNAVDVDLFTPTLETEAGNSYLFAHNS